MKHNYHYETDNWVCHPANKYKLYRVQSRSEK